MTTMRKLFTNPISVSFMIRKRIINGTTMRFLSSTSTVHNDNNDNNKNKNNASAPVVVYISKSNDIYYNLAYEDYILREKIAEIRNDKAKVMFLWANTAAIVIGRNQNPWTEVNMKSLLKQNVPLVRYVLYVHCMYVYMYGCCIYK